MIDFQLSGRTVWIAAARPLLAAALVRRLLAEDVEILAAGGAALRQDDAAARGAWLGRHAPQVIFLDTLADGAATLLAGILAAGRFRPARLMLLGPVPDGMAAALDRLGEAVTHLLPLAPYGPEDDFTGTGTLPALMAGLHMAAQTQAPSLAVPAAPAEDYLHADDLADAAIHFTGHVPPGGPLALGRGCPVERGDLADRLARIVGFTGKLVIEGGERKSGPAADAVRLAALGWQPAVGLDDGLAATYRWYRRQAGTYIRSHRVDPARLAPKS